MPSENEWIKVRVAKTRTDHPRVTDAATARLEALLTKQLGERQLPAAELASVAKVLLVDMEPQVPEPDR